LNGSGDSIDINPGTPQTNFRPLIVPCQHLAGFFPVWQWQSDGQPGEIGCTHSEPAGRDRKPEEAKLSASRDVHLCAVIGDIFQCVTVAEGWIYLTWGYKTGHQCSF